jgi:hypothetical protein
MNVQRGDIVLVDFPVKKLGIRCVLLLLCNHMCGDLTTRLSRLLPVVVIEESVLPHSIRLTFRPQKVNKLGYDSIPLFNAKI